MESRRLQVRIDQDDELLWEWVGNQRNVSRAVREVLRSYVEAYGTGVVTSVGSFDQGSSVGEEKVMRMIGQAVGAALAEMRMGGPVDDSFDSSDVCRDAVCDRVETTSHQCRDVVETESADVATGMTGGLSLGSLIDSAL